MDILGCSKSIKVLKTVSIGIYIYGHIHSSGTDASWGPIRDLDLYVDENIKI